MNPFFKSWFKFFSWTILIAGFVALIGYLDLKISGKKLPEDALKDATIVILAIAIFVYPLNELRSKIIHKIWDVVGSPWENQEKFKQRVSKKTLTTIRLILVGILILVVLLIILNR
ncbi:MAG: hypothetical protein ED557_05890 [Balneola sp.]|nr:MAG: hypothetical protein ED557_05890 [Balneola sp.]